MFRPKVSIDRDLYEKIRYHAGAAGYATWEEFVRHTLEKEIARREGAGSEDEIRKRLQGLGYIS